MPHCCLPARGASPSPSLESGSPAFAAPIRSKVAPLVMISFTSGRTPTPASMWEMKTLLQSDRMRTSVLRRAASRMRRCDSTGIRRCPRSLRVATIVSREIPRRCISDRMSFVTATKEAGISRPSSKGSSSGASVPTTASPASARVTVLSKSISNRVSDTAFLSTEGRRAGCTPGVEAEMPSGESNPLPWNHLTMPKRLAMTGRTSSSCERDWSRGSTASQRKRSSGSLRKAKTGMPLLGWFKNASGVSSTSTVRERSRPRQDMSFTQE
mmetsp:Transcript_4336/g.12202  ORF Transcript_4336/g.12202 Transcript_4336/m.12202 type:complete len:269 (+) Transcript_4336:609-1415(+)